MGKHREKTFYEINGYSIEDLSMLQKEQLEIALKTHSYIADGFKVAYYYVFDNFFVNEKNAEYVYFSNREDLKKRLIKTGIFRREEIKKEDKKGIRKQQLLEWKEKFISILPIEEIKITAYLITEGECTHSYAFYNQDMFLLND